MPIDTPSEAWRRFALGRKAWPQLAVDFPVFEAYFAQHASPEASPLEARAADMYLACACAHGVEGALDAFESTFARDVARAIASIDPRGVFVEEALQVMRERLFVPRGEALGKIATYGGRASLKSWLCAVAVRLALSQRRRKDGAQHGHFAFDDDRRLATGGPELEYLSGRYKGAFESALGVAIGQLPSKDRMFLRLNLVDGMSIDKLAVAYGVGRSTAARWLAGARGALVDAVRREIHAQLNLTSTELDSLGAAICSHLDVSVAEWLSRTNGEDGPARRSSV